VGEIDKPLYVPTDVDIKWAQNMIDGTPDGGTLRFQSAQLTYRVDHARRTLTLQNPERLTTHFNSFVAHQQTVVVFKEIGYTVEESQSDRGDGDMVAG